MEKLEAKKTSELMKWLKYKYKRFSGGFEVKVVRGDKFYFSSGSTAKELVMLKKCQEDGIIYKNPDTGWGTPFDIFAVYGKAYIIIFFGDVKKFYIIPIDKILNMVNNNKKSLTENEAQEIATEVGYLKGGGSQ